MFSLLISLAFFAISATCSIGSYVPSCSMYVGIVTTGIKGSNQTNDTRSELPLLRISKTI